MPSVALTQPSRRPRRYRALVVTLAVALGLGLAVAAGCGPAGHSSSSAGSPSASATPSPPKSTAHISIRPGQGSRSAKTQRGIVVRVRGGILTGVNATAAGGAVGGSFESSSTEWRSRWALKTDTDYKVTATAVDPSGLTVTKTSRFHTLTPKSTFSARIFEGSGVTYGVGMPVMIQFSSPVVNKKAVEAALQLSATRHVVGAWYWENSSLLHFRPRDYWPQNITVSFVGHLDGVESAPGVYGVHTLKQEFKIGESLIAVASTTSHHVRIYKDKRLWATWPCSTGRPGKDTPNGTYLTIEKANPQRMVGPGYDLQVPWSVRFTWSGNFMHDASWSVGVQGSANVSHGCVNLSPEHAQTYYELAIPGDPVTITGSPKAGKWGDGWTVWFLSWKELLHGSALHMAVKVGPDGSTFVAPLSLHRSKAKAPVGRPQKGNAAAS